MTQDPAKPLEPNSSDQPTDSQPTDSQPTDSQPTNASSTPDISTPEASPNLPLTEEAAVSEAIEPSSPLEGISDLPSAPQAGETANPPTGTPTSVNQPIESVAMTDATQHSSSGESSNASKEPAPAASSRSDKTPSAKSDKAPTGSTSAIGQIFKQIWAVILALTPVVVGIGRSLWRLLLIVAKWIREGWKLLLPRIRAVLPEGWNKLPDWAIATVAVALLVFIVWITTLLLPTRAPAQPSDRPPAISTPSQPQPELSPDPALIARIQEQVTEVADKYTEGLIQSVQTNFGGSELTVNISDGWYDLPSNRQDTLANDILNRSRQLDFESVKLVDGDGEVLARSPVVGTRMVVYRGGSEET